MTDHTKKKKPKWLKKLKRLMNSDDEKDREALKAVIDKLVHKSADLEQRIQQETDDAEKARLQDKLALIQKHLKKGLKKLGHLYQPG